MDSYRHSVVLDVEKCTGCTTCVRHCPTEAIRINGGHAEINTDRCIDCGECIRLCPHNAKKAMCSKFEHYLHYKWKVAMPAPALFGQFDGLDDVDVVLQALLNAHGWDSGKADGVYGAKTQAAVNQAKKFYGMEPDGKCTEELWIKLGIDPAIFLKGDKEVSYA